MNYKLQIRSAVFIFSLVFGNSVFAECEVEEAIELFQQGKTDLADEQFKQCILRGSSVGESHFYLGIISRNNNNLEVARENLSKAVTNNPKNIGYQLELGVTYEWLGELDKAKNIYHNILEQEPENIPASLGVARMEHWQGYVNRSIRNYRNILSKHPANQAAELGLAFALLADNKLKESDEIFKKIISIDPSNSSAHDGITMLTDIRTRKLEFSGGALKPESGESLNTFRLRYSETPSYKLRWGVELVNYERPVIPLNPYSIPNSQSLEKELTLFGNLRFNDRSSLFLSATGQSMTGDSERSKLHLEATHKMTNGDRVLLGFIPTYDSGKLINSLSYAGYILDTALSWSPMAQLFYGDDEIFGSSRAVSLSASIPYGKRNHSQIGGSMSQTGNMDASSLFANTTHYINREIAITASLVNNFSTNELAFTLGVIYEF